MPYQDNLSTRLRLPFRCLRLMHLQIVAEIPSSTISAFHVARLRTVYIVLSIPWTLYCSSPLSFFNTDSSINPLLPHSGIKSGHLFFSVFLPRCGRGLLREAPKMFRIQLHLVCKLPSNGPKMNQKPNRQNSSASQCTVLSLETMRRAERDFGRALGVSVISANPSS